MAKSLRDEIEAMMEGLTFFDTMLSAEEFVQLLDGFEAIAVTAGSRIEGALYQQISDMIRGIPSKELLDIAANNSLQAARIEARNLVTNMVQTQLSAIDEVVRDGLAKGLNPRQIVKNLDMVRELDSVRARKLLSYEDGLRKLGLPEDAIRDRVSRMYDAELKDRKETIARTEATFAQGVAAEQHALANGSTHKVWVNTGDSRVSDVCRSNGAQGPIEIKKSFQSGHSRVPAHPRCRCSIAYMTSPAQIERAKARADAREQQIAEAIQGEQDGKP